MIGGKMIGHRPISTSQHHPGAQRRQLRTGAIEAEQGQRGHGGRKPGKGMSLATSPQNECENRRRRPSRGLAHTPGTPIFALFRWTSERAASIRCPDGGSGQGSFASFLKGPLPPSGHRIERGTIDLQSDINCLPERSLLGAFGKQHDDYDHDVFNSAGSTLATPHFGPENAVHLSGRVNTASMGRIVGKIPHPHATNSLLGRRETFELLVSSSHKRSCGLVFHRSNRELKAVEMWKSLPRKRKVILT